MIMKNGQFIKTMQPGYATPDEVMDAHGSTIADVKYDGFRVQMHKKGNKFKAFTRNANEYLYAAYPELEQVAAELPDCIIEGELIGEGKSHAEQFNNMQKRFRRPGLNQKKLDELIVSTLFKDIPLNLRVFETLEFEGQDLSQLPLEQRRACTNKFDSKLIKPVEYAVAENLEELEAVLENTFKGTEEGRVCKNPQSLYMPGKRNINWVKFKRSETLDLAVVGVYDEKKLKHLNLPFTSALVATYNKESGQYETICKVSTRKRGLADKMYKKIKDKLQSQKPDNTNFSKKMTGSHVPDLYIAPEDSVVLEISAMNLTYSSNWHTCGQEGNKSYSARVCHPKDVRYDKASTQATSTQDVIKLYALQEGN